MDPFTQGIFGATLASSNAKKKKIRKACFYGFIGGLAPDLDILINSDTDHLLGLEYHRHFTHSIAFIPIGSLIIAILLWLISSRQKKGFSEIYIFILLGYATHGFLDASTSYGTLLFWPFSNNRISLNLISIIDPIFTFVIFFSLILAIIKKSNKFSIFGFSFALFYLSLGAINQLRVKNHIEKIAKQRNHQIERSFFNPTIGNNILWRSVYQYQDKYYIDAVFTPIFKKIKFKQGKIVNKIDKNNIYSSIPKDSILRNDIKRFSWFSKDFIYLNPQNPKIISDLRYGVLPDSNRSLWGIKLDLENPNQHAKFINHRNITDKDYEIFWQMLKGNNFD